MKTKASLFKMDSVSEMIESMGLQDEDFSLAFPARYAGYNLERMKKLVIEHNSHRLDLCGISSACGPEISEAVLLIESRMDEVTSVAERLIRCVNLGMDLY